MHTSIVTKCGIFGGWVTVPREEFHFTKGNCQNYGRCTTQHLIQQSKQLEIPPVPCQYILLLMSFIISIQQYVQTNSSEHNINTRNKHHLHRLNANLSCFQKSTFYAGIKIFSSLPPSETVLKYKAKFKAALRKYLNTHRVHSIDEYFKCDDDL